MRSPGPGGPRVLRLSVEVYRLLLRIVYPARFRRRHGEEMVRLFRDRGRDALRSGGTVGMLGHWAGAFRDVVMNGLAERMGGGRWL